MTMQIFETAVLELLCVVVVETPYSVLNFQPLLFKLEADFSEENERKSSYRVYLTTFKYMSLLVF